MNPLLQPCRVLALLAAAALGCSSGDRVPMHPVRGQVLYNGKPVKGAQVVFHPLEPQSVNVQKPLAYTDAEGRFSLMSERPGDGAPAGEYAVTVEQRERTAWGREEVKARNLLPTRYSQPKTSGLRFQVQPGENEMPPLHLTDK